MASARGLVGLLALTAGVALTRAFQFPANCAASLYCEYNCERWDKEKECTVKKGDGDGDLWDQLTSDPNLSMFTELLKEAGLDSLLAINGSFQINLTNVILVWAPSNEAMQQVPYATWNAMKNDSTIMENILRTHLSVYDPEARTESRTLAEDDQFLDLGITVGNGPNEANLVLTTRCQLESPAYLYKDDKPQAINGHVYTTAGLLVPCSLREKDSVPLPMAPGGLPVFTGNTDILPYFDNPLLCSAPSAPQAKKMVYYTKKFKGNVTFDLNIGNGKTTPPVDITELQVDGLLDALGNAKIAGAKSSWVCYELDNFDGTQVCAEVDGQRGTIGFKSSEGEVKSVRVALQSSCGGLSKFVNATQGKLGNPDNADDLTLYNNWGCNWYRFSDRIHNVTISNYLAGSSDGQMPMVRATVSFDVAPFDYQDTELYPPAAETLGCLGFKLDKSNSSTVQCMLVPREAKGVFSLGLNIPDAKSEEAVKGTLWAQVRETDTCGVFAVSDKVKILE